MSLKVYIDGQIQAFRQKSAGDLLFGMEDAPTFRLLPIHGADESGSTDAPTEITAVKISKTYPFQELERVVLPIDLIKFDIASNQYITDITKIIAAGVLEEWVYYLEFKNGYNVFTTDPFSVKIMDLPITADMTIITADSTIIKTDTSHIII